MTKLTFAAAFESLQSLKPSGLARQQFNQQALARRMDRIGSRPAGRPVLVSSVPQHLDARLLEDGAALETAWQAELATMVAFRRTPTLERRAAVKAARAAAEAIVARIETARALTLDGLRIQARAVLWRRDGEPLGPAIPDEQESEDAWTDMAEMPHW